eukprot:6178566-Pleurochrysis_carterae.AAC.7
MLLHEMKPVHAASKRDSYLQVGVGLVDRVDAVLAKRVHGLINVGQVCPAVPAAAGELDRDVPGGLRKAKKCQANE